MIESRAVRFLLLASAVSLALGCSEEAPPPTNTVRRDATTDAFAGVDARPDIPGIDPCGPAPCGPVERCGAPREDGAPGSGDGLDDNCDGRVDEGCICRPGEMRACFTGTPDRRGVGACRDGVMRCTELGAWVGNECTGATNPARETCDGRDEDCNGAIDNGLADCQTALRCPPAAGAAPLENFSLDGRTIDATARGFRWEVACPEGVSPCPMPTNPADPVLRFMAVREGLYRVTLTLMRDGGRTDTCRFPLYIQGRGLRVELDWDRKGGVASPGVDLDVHVVALDRTTRTSPRWFTTDDCYFATCKAPGAMVNWAASPADTRFAPTADSSRCANAPPPFGDLWRASGRCWNPRLDTDNIVCDPALRDPRDPAFCFPENAAVDDPPDHVTFRLAVNFYRDHGACDDMDARNDVAHPTLTVSCGGLLRAAVGSVEDGLVSMSCRDNPEIGSLNWTWLAADVRFVTNACGVRDCRVTPLRAVAPVRSCASATPADDFCGDERGRIFVRRSGGRDALAEFPESP